MLGAVQEKLTVLEHVRLAVSALYSTLGQPDRSLFRCLFTGLLLLLILLIHADDNILGVQVGIGGAFVRPGFTVCTCSISSSCCRTFSAGGKIKQISFKPRASTVRCDTTDVPALILCFCIIEIFCGVMKNVWTQNDVHPVTFGVKKKKSISEKEHALKMVVVWWWGLLCCFRIWTTWIQLNAVARPQKDAWCFKTSNVAELKTSCKKGWKKISPQPSERLITWYPNAWLQLLPNHLCRFGHIS